MSEKRSYMTHNAGGYQVHHWDHAAQCYRASHTMPYQQARRAVGEANCPGERGGKCRCASHAHIVDPVATCAHNEMVECDIPGHARKCAACGYVCGMGQ